MHSRIPRTLGRMARCPACRERIPFGTIFLAPLPGRIRCPGCATALRGNWLVRVGGAAKAGVALGGTVGAIWWVLAHVPTFPARVVMFLFLATGVFFAVGVPMTLLAHRLGRYERR